jgi:hypothetical protein
MLWAILFMFCGWSLAQSTYNNDAIIKLVKAGLSDDLIISTVQGQPGSYDISPNGMIAMKSAGVSDKVLTAISPRLAQSI